MKKQYAPIDLHEVKLSSLGNRPRKVGLKDFARPMSAASAKSFLDSLPSQLKANEFRTLIALCAKARAKGKPVHLMMGAHVIKVGLNPLIIDLMRRRIVTGVSFNGAGIIHELELAFHGATSEDVSVGLRDGSFGMARETAAWFRAAVSHSLNLNEGLGAGVGDYIRRAKATNARFSILATARELHIPATIHTSIGADIVAQHPTYDAAGVGKLSHDDFRLLAAVLADADCGATAGVVINAGSAAILPEVFLKALTVARNINHQKNTSARASGAIVTANFDMISQYRARVNVVERPTQATGRGFDFVGHHEIMLPLFAWALRGAVR